MPWVREDDNEALNRKVRPLSDSAYRLNHHARQFASRHLTDGLVYLRDAEEWTLGVKGKRIKAYIAELVDAGLWHEYGQTCDSPRCPAYPCAEVEGAWALHNYTFYNPTRQQVEDKRRQTSQAAQRSVERRADKSPNASLSETLSETLDESLSRGRALPRPIPSRPVPERKRHAPLPPDDDRLTRLIDWGLPKGGAFGSEKQMETLMNIYRVHIGTDDLIDMLDRWYDAEPEDNKPQSWSWFWRKVQDIEHLALKGPAQPVGRLDGLAHISAIPVALK